MSFFVAYRLGNRTGMRAYHGVDRVVEKIALRTVNISQRRRPSFVSLFAAMPCQ